MQSQQWNVVSILDINYEKNHAIIYHFYISFQPWNMFLSHGQSERGYNPETPSNFWNNLKVTPLDDTPTKARIGGVCHLVKLLWLHPHDRHQEAVVLIRPVLG